MRRGIVGALAIAIVISVSGAAMAEGLGPPETGHYLYDNCVAHKGDFAESEERCWAYIEGVIDTMFIVNPRPAGLSVCPLPGIAIGQIEDAVRTFLVKKPQSLDWSGPLAVAGALHEAWPCGGLH